MLEQPDLDKVPTISASDTLCQVSDNIFALPVDLLPRMKRRKAVTKSPYFTPPITPSQTQLSIANPKPELSDLTNTLPITGARMASPLKSTQNTTTPTSPSPKKPPLPPGLISCIPFPPLSSPTFGLIQERLAPNPFRLLIAVTFLNRTHGKHAIPVFFSLMQAYPTPASLLSAKKEDIVSIIQHLGLQNQRAATYQSYANIWLETPPVKDKRYPVRNYPFPEVPSQRIKKDEVLLDSDPRPNAWEIGHILQGPYALDSWRIFCRDVLRGVATGWNGEGSKEESFQPEWMRVLPKDKELRAFLRWMWLKEGFEWDPVTGEKDVASGELLNAVEEERIAWDEEGGLKVLEERIEIPKTMMQVGNLGDAERALERVQNAIGDFVTIADELNTVGVA